MIEKDKLKGKYITYRDKDGSYRTHKVIKIEGLLLTVVDATGSRTRIHPDKTKNKKYGVKIFGRQLKRSIEEINWKNDKLPK